MDTKEKIKLIVLGVLFSLNAHAWGRNGHRIVAAIAYDHLQEKSKQKVKEILGDVHFVDASTWADEIKSDPKWQYSKTYHYTNYDKDGKPLKGKDLLSMLKDFEEKLKNHRSSKEELKTSLKFFVHLMGDLHNPLHLGLKEDRGGNDFNITWMGKRSNLHRLWDEQLIEMQNLSYSEYKAFLVPLKVKDWSKGNYDSWAMESVEIRKRVYPNKNESLGFHYHYKWKETLDTQLKKAGLRLALLLNSIF